MRSDFIHTNLLILSAECALVLSSLHDVHVLREALVTLGLCCDTKISVLLQCAWDPTHILINFI